MTIETLQYVYAAYKYGSYKEASYALSVSYSVVAKQVARAEEELGVRLFERAAKSKAMELSPAGEILINEIETILDAYDRMQNCIYGFSHDKRKRLRIGYGQYFPCEEELSILAMFSQKNPNITLSQKTGDNNDLRKQLSIGILDGIFASLLGDDSPSKVGAIFPPEEYEVDLVSVNRRFHFLMSRQNPLAGFERFTVEDRPALLAQTFIITNTADCETKKVPPDLPEYLGVTRGDMKVRFMDSSNLPLLPMILQDGNYIYPTLRRFTKPLDEVVSVPVVDWKVPVYVYFVCPKGSSSLSLQLFRQCVREYASQIK